MVKCTQISKWGYQEIPTLVSAPFKLSNTITGMEPNLPHDLVSQYGSSHLKTETNKLYITFITWTYILITSLQCHRPRLIMQGEGELPSTTSPHHCLVTYTLRMQFSQVQQNYICLGILYTYCFHTKIYNRMSEGLRLQVYPDPRGLHVTHQRLKAIKILLSMHVAWWIYRWKQQV